MSSSRGLRLMKALELCRKKIPNIYDVTTVLNKVNIISMSQGSAKASFIVDTSMCNSGGTLHGGYVASVVDILSFYTILSDTDGRISWTCNLNVDYTKVAAIGEKVTAETNLLKNGNTPVLETSFHNESGAILARGVARFQAGSQKYQNMFKELVNFDVYEN